jgi:bifunctional non-homologous end joining protein LigD
MPVVPSTSGFIVPCIPTRAPEPPMGPDWVHEVKHDGYRLQVRRDGDAVRLFTRRGYDWSGRYSAIAVTAMLLRARSFTLDGEAVVCGPDGIAIFDALHRRGVVSEAMLYAFDLLELDGEDLRSVPLGDRKKRLARLVGKRRLGIVLSEHTDEDGATIFRQACRMGLEGIVAKRLGAPYRSGPSPDWIKVKNPDSPAMMRHRDGNRPPGRDRLSAPPGPSRADGVPSGLFGVTVGCDLRHVNRPSAALGSAHLRS